MKIARVLVRHDHVADCVWLAIPQPTEWQRIGNQIDAAKNLCAADFVKVRRTLRVAGACEFKYLVAWSG